MNYSIIDIEADGLLERENNAPEATKIYCMSVKKLADGVAYSFSTTDYDVMRGYLSNEETLIGHNIVRYDVPMLEKFLGIKINCRIIDTLGLSWYLYPNRIVHGLESWGEDLGIAKPKIEDWLGLSIEEYVNRCEEDVKITNELWEIQWRHLLTVYDESEERALRLSGYLTFKLECAREQEEVKWKLDVAVCTKNLIFFQGELDMKIKRLKEIMPRVIKYKPKERPKTLYKKDGSFSVAGTEWLRLLAEQKLPDYHIGPIKVVESDNPPNPGSHQQLKAWLFSLGWVPESFKYVKEAGKPERAIPQIGSLEEAGVLCDSVKRLIEANLELEALEGFFVLRHRIGLLTGFLEDRDDEDFLKAQIKGFTNTLRFTHTTIVNLPTLYKPYGKEIRECLIAPNSNYLLCGSDMAGLEDTTKRHYMYYYDPKYVEEMTTEGYDPHLDIAVLAKVLTEDQKNFYRWYKSKKEMFADLVPEKWKTMSEEEQVKMYLFIGEIRDKAKKSGFAAVYGAGGPKIALTARIPTAEGYIFHKAYWKKNWSVKRIAEDTIHKAVGSQMWLYNPVSQFWYTLRSIKDKFSTLNQSTGVYCFDSWIRHVRSNRYIKLCGQFHDEICFPLYNKVKDIVRQKLNDAIDKTNDELQLNLKLGISIDFGNNYAEIH